VPDKEPISLLEARLAQGEEAAREMLRRLEKAMVRCGYVRNGVYNSRDAGFSGRRDHAVVIHWKDKRIKLGRGLKKGKDGKALRSEGRYLPNPTIPVDHMLAGDLITVAHHLAPFLDSLEGKVRHQLEQLTKATATIQAMLDRIEAEPLPSDTPAQMSEDIG